MSKTHYIQNDLWKDHFADCPAVTMNKNSLIAEEGTSINQIYYIESGRVKFSITTPDGNEKIMYIVNKGELIGDLWSASSRPYFMTATTLTKCTFRTMEPKAFMGVLFSSRELAESWMGNLSEVMEFLVDHVTELVFLDKEQIIVKYIYRLSFNYGVETPKGIKINTKVTHQLFADLMGCSRITVSKIMSHLIKRNIIAREDGYIYITDMDELKRLLDL
ncbi:Crp/Fnr family transcriptional regulator [Cohnella rhizosphaerae]|uniref:Crp/Fnr family transcriptional regulator n=1 Tax=Cohnella rhizosphaerae TaxID=1457232 RepID=A0A9X4L0U0_9BACL|nr:Crp/Fnr family transcriptional regulator [Cohnella rhizosphaerae]MDG0811432.1 Crp/Fnr family transcriptional regulator [Cohnella rhizosphaerae]